MPKSYREEEVTIPPIIVDDSGHTTILPVVPRWVLELDHLEVQESDQVEAI